MLKGLFAVHLAAVSVTPRWRTSLVLPMLPPNKMFPHTNEGTQLEKTGRRARENTLVGFLFNYKPALLAYSTMLKMSTTDGGWVLKAH